MFRQAEVQARQSIPKSAGSSQQYTDKLIFELFIRRILDSGDFYTYLNLVLPMASEYGILVHKQMYKSPFVDAQFVQAVRSKILRCQIDVRDIRQIPAELESHIAIFSDHSRTDEQLAIVEQNWLGNVNTGTFLKQLKEFKKVLTTLDDQGECSGSVAYKINTMIIVLEEVSVTNMMQLIHSSFQKQKRFSASQQFITHETALFLLGNVDVLAALLPFYACKYDDRQNEICTKTFGLQSALSNCAYCWRLGKALQNLASVENHIQCQSPQ